MCRADRQGLGYDDKVADKPMSTMAALSDYDRVLAACSFDNGSIATVGLTVDR
jgi:hypothetical protein